MTLRGEAELWSLLARVSIALTGVRPPPLSGRHQKIVEHTAHIKGVASTGASTQQAAAVRDISGQRTRKAFEQFDTNSSGAIDETELQALLLYLGYDLPLDVFKAVLAGVDADGSGVVDYGEFTEMLRVLAGEEEGKQSAPAVSAAERAAEQHQRTKASQLFLQQDGDQHEQALAAKFKARMLQHSDAGRAYRKRVLAAEEKDLLEARKRREEEAADRQAEAKEQLRKARRGKASGVQDEAKQQVRGLLALGHLLCHSISNPPRFRVVSPR